MNGINLPPARKVGHLTLIRKGREISVREYNALSASERIDMIRRARGREKYSLLLAAEDVEDLVTALPAQEIYLLLREMGLEDISELVAVLNTEQLTLLIDLDAWQGDGLDEKRLLVWLQFLLDAGQEKVAQTLEAMDNELVPALFRPFVTVVHGPEAYDDEEAEKAGGLTGLYQLTFHHEESAKLISALFDALLKEAPNYYVWLLEAMRAETPSVLLEYAFEQHRGRMLDHGFADPAEARLIYAYLNPHHFKATAVKAKVLPPEEDTLPPSYLLRVEPTQDLLTEVLANGIDDATSWEFSLLLNRFMAADGIDVGEADQVATAVEQVCQTLNLGLEHLADGQIDRALEVFRQTYLQDVFRVGFSLMLELKQRAQRLKQTPIEAYLDAPYRQVLDALDQPHPQLYLGLSPQPKTSTCRFADRRHLQQASRLLDDIEAQEHLFDGALPFHLPAPQSVNLDTCLPARVEDLCLSHLLLTGLANKLLDGEFRPLPLTVERLVDLHGIVTTDQHLEPQVREGIIEWLEGLTPNAGAFGHYCLDLWEEGFCRLDSQQIDPRFVSGLMVQIETG